MGGKVTSFVKDVAKEGLKGATSYVLGTYIPYVGGHLANYINSKYAKGGVLEVGGNPPDLPEGLKPKEISTPSQLKSLIQKFPEQASKVGLTVEKVDEEVKEAKQISKAVGGMMKGSYMKSDIESRPKLQPVKEKKEKLGHQDVVSSKGGQELAKRPKMAKGGEPVAKLLKCEKGGSPGGKSPGDIKKVKKPRSQAQIEATKRLVEANRKRREKK
jgi:hypothetical protein